MKTPEHLGSLAARVAIAALFVVSGAGKLAGLAGTAATIGAKGLPAPMLAAVLAGLLELVGGLLLLVGLRAGTAALALAIFLVPATALFHSPAGLTGMEAHMQVLQILKNLAIAGGLLLVATWGAGSLSLDGRRQASARLQPDHFATPR